MKSYLNKYLGPQDIQIGAWHNSLETGGKFNRKFYLDILSSIYFYRAISKWGIKKIVEIISPNNLNKKELSQSVNINNPSKSEFIRFLNSKHKRTYKNKLSNNPTFSTPEEIKNYIPKEWNNYFKFCFVRNPYDKAVSDYLWKTKNRRKYNISFLEFLKLANGDLKDKKNILPSPVTNWPIYTENDKIVVDYIGKFENLYSDFNDVCKMINIPFDKATFPFIKKNNNRDKYNKEYRKYYGEKEKSLVEKIYEKELNEFGYKF